MKSFNTIKNIFSLLGAVFVVGFLLVGLSFLLQGNINSLQVKIANLNQQVQILPKKEKFLLARLSLEKDIALLEKEKITLQNNAYWTIVQTVGALSIIATAYFSLRNVKTAEANLRATEEKVVTDRFSKAVELLAHEDLSARVGDIFALERIAKDSEKDYWQVMEVLTAYVRDKKKIENRGEPLNKEYKPVNKNVEGIEDDSPLDDPFYTDPEGNIHDWDQLSKDMYNNYYYPSLSANKDYVHPIDVDIQAILTVLGRRQKLSLSKANPILSLERTDLQGAILTGDLTSISFEKANLGYAILKDSVNLSGVNFYKAVMIQIQVINGANLEKANLSGARLEYADLSGSNLRGTNFQSSYLNKSKFHNVIVDQKTDFTEAIVFKTTDFTGIRIKTIEDFQIQWAKNWAEGIYSPNLARQLGIDEL